MLRRAKPLLGTIVEIGVAEGGNRAIEATNRAFAELARIQALMSFQDPASELSYVNGMALKQSVRISRDLFIVLKRAVEVSSASGGAFNPNYRLAADLSAGSFRRDLVLESTRRVRFLRPLLLDLSGIAKGYAVDRAVAALKRAGIGGGLVNAGGDIRAFGENGETVGIRHPRAPEGVSHVLLLRERSMATSGSYGESALYRGMSGVPVPRNESVTVVARSCLIADSLTKTFWGLSPPQFNYLLAHYKAKAYVVTN